jgi:hypothetical protein
MARPSPPLPASRRLTACIAALLAASVAACGSSTATDRTATATARTATPPTAPGAPSTAGAASTLTPAACASTVAGTLGEVAERVYHAAVTGTVVDEAVGRVHSSTALASAVAAGNASAAGAALRALLRGQIARIEVVRDGRALAAAGAGPAIAPVRGSIPGTGASYVLSVQPDRDYVQVAGQVTGAQVLLLAGGRRVGGTITGPSPTSIPASGALSYAGRSYEVSSLAGATYPAGALRIALLVPARALSCSGSGPQTRVETLARAGENIYKEELASPTVSATLRRLEASSTFREAVAAQDPAAAHEAIDGFFKAHIHVVRVRVTVGGHLLIDDGGPYVLAPVRGTLRSGGHVIGRFEMSVQDDAGYLKLAHLFTGAQVLMRVGGRQVRGTLSPGPATVPARGVVSYGGRSYEAYTFTAEAFPSGPLEISLLIPA